MSRVQIPSSAPSFAGPAAVGPAFFLGEVSVATRSPKADSAAVERAVAELIRALGLDPSLDPELASTPERVAEFYREALSGLEGGAEPELVTFPSTGEPGLVVIRDLPFHSLCVHHFAPFFGRATVAYLPAGRL